MQEGANAKQQIVERLKSSTNILVTVSSNPSVDELSAALALTLILNKMGKKATAVFSGKIPPAIQFLEPNKTFEGTVDSLRDFIIALDKEKADRLRYKVDGDMVRIFITPYHVSLSEKDLKFSYGDFNVETIIALGVEKREELDRAIVAHGRILHDASILTINCKEGKNNLGSVDWQDLDASCLCEMLMSMSEALQSGLLDEQIASALLTGIVAATNRFSNDLTRPRIMTMAAQLMAAGANQQLIATKLESAHIVVPPRAGKDEKDKTRRRGATLNSGVQASDSEAKKDDVEFSIEGAGKDEVVEDHNDEKAALASDDQTSSEEDGVTVGDVHFEHGKHDKSKKSKPLDSATAGLSADDIERKKQYDATDSAESALAAANVEKSEAEKDVAGSDDSALPLAPPTPVLADLEKELSNGTAPTEKQDDTPAVPSWASQTDTDAAAVKIEDMPSQSWTSPQFEAETSAQSDSTEPSIAATDEGAMPKTDEQAGEMPAVGDAPLPPEAATTEPAPATVPEQPAPDALPAVAADAPSVMPEAAPELAPYAPPQEAEAPLPTAAPIEQPAPELPQYDPASAPVPPPLAEAPQPETPAPAPEVIPEATSQVNPSRPLLGGDQVASGSDQISSTSDDSQKPGSIERDSRVQPFGQSSWLAKKIDPPTMGGTLSATSEQALDAKRVAEEKERNLSLLTHEHPSTTSSETPPAVAAALTEMNGQASAPMFSSPSEPVAPAPSAADLSPSPVAQAVEPSMADQLPPVSEPVQGADLANAQSTVDAALGMPPPPPMPEMPPVDGALPPVPPAVMPPMPDYEQTSAPPPPAPDMSTQFGMPAPPPLPPAPDMSADLPPMPAGLAAPEAGGMPPADGTVPPMPAGLESPAPYAGPGPQPLASEPVLTPPPANDPNQFRIPGQ